MKFPSNMGGGGKDHTHSKVFEICNLRIKEVNHIPDSRFGTCAVILVLILLYWFSFVSFAFCLESSRDGYFSHSIPSNFKRSFDLINFYQTCFLVGIQSTLDVS